MTILSFNPMGLYPTLSLSSFSPAQKALLIFSLLMVLAMLPTYVWAQFDTRTLREVGVWVKPLKFMAATALFAASTVYLAQLSGTDAGAHPDFMGIAALIIATSLFEVAYIMFQASQGAGSHYNTADRVHAAMYGLMAIAAIGLTASQAWLAWVIWSEAKGTVISVTTWGVLAGLVLTFVLSTVSGFLLGGNQAPAGTGLPMLGWHAAKDLRPAHFLGTHAQQFIPILGILAERTLGPAAPIGLVLSIAMYCMGWMGLTWIGLAR